MSRFAGLLAVCALVLAATGSTKAASYDLVGFSSSQNLPLSAKVVLDVISPTQLKVAVTNTASLAGPDNRITMFGIQVPNDTVTGSIVVAETADSWLVGTDVKLPGNGADDFEFLQGVTTVGTTAGLNLGEKLTVLYTSTTPLFDPLNIFAWPPTEKMGYVMAAKWQSVGKKGNDSGVAGTVVPEPASLALIGVPAMLLVMRRRRRQAA